MKLFILRHAKTEKVSVTGKDFDRDLKKVGFNQLELMRDFFKTNFEELDFRVYCSTATRTKSTLSEIEPAINIKKLTFHDELYLPNLKELLHFLWNQSDESNPILLIGHNFGLSDLCSYLSGEAVVLPTCGLIVYEFPDFSNLNEISKDTAIEINRFFPKV